MRAHARTHPCMHALPLTLSISQRSHTYPHVEVYDIALIAQSLSLSLSLSCTHTQFPISQCLSLIVCKLSPAQAFANTFSISLSPTVSNTHDHLNTNTFSLSHTQTNTHTHSSIREDCLTYHLQNKLSLSLSLSLSFSLSHSYGVAHETAGS